MVSETPPKRGPGEYVIALLRRLWNRHKRLVVLVEWTIIGVIIVFRAMFSLFPTATSGEQLDAAAAIVGGVIGAGGAALAVYLTLAGQRKDEAQKVEAALLMEVAEFGRLAVGALSPFEGVLTKNYDNIPMRDLPVLTAMPQPVVYKATADRISRLEYGSLFVSFHSRIAEAQQMATILAVTARPRVLPGILPVERMLDESAATTLATGWLDVCNIARTILRKGPDAHALADAAIAATLADLDAALTRVGPLVTKSGNQPGPAAP